jgi:hypothetical protein
MTEQQKFENWGILELFGHLRLAGLISEQTFGSSTMIRIDVPAVADLPEYTRFFGVSAIYSITPTTEEIARGVAQTLRAQPVHHYDLPAADQGARLTNHRLRADDDFDEEGSGF